MRHASVIAFAACLGLTLSSPPLTAGEDSGGNNRHVRADQSIQLGVRPFFLVQGMDPGPLKTRLLKCQNGPFRRTDFSIAHRGAPSCMGLQ